MALIKRGKGKILGTEETVPKEISPKEAKDKQDGKKKEGDDAPANVR